MLALGCGLVASIGITQVIGNRDTAPADPTGNTNAIFVALEDVAFGEPLTPQALRLENWPKDKIPKGALSRIEDVEGRRTRAKLYSGEPILENKLFPKGASEQGYSTVIPKGYRVIPVRVDQVSGSGLILPGDRVDVLVYLTKNPPKGILKTSARTILQNVKVFAVNNTVDTESKDEKTMAAQTISLLVKPENAQLVMLADELGEIRLVMRSPEDDATPTVEDTTPSVLLDADESENPLQEGLLAAGGAGGSAQGPGFLSFLEQLKSQKAGTPQTPLPTSQPNGRKVHRMRIVDGPEVKDVVLEMDEEQSNADSGFEVWRMKQGWEASAPAAPAGSPEPAVEPAVEPEPSPAGDEPAPQQPQEAND